MKSKSGTQAIEGSGVLFASLLVELRDLAVTDRADDAHLGRLALQVEETAARVRSDVHTHFDQVEKALPGDLLPMRKAVNHLSSLAEKDFFLGALLLLLIETGRQRSFAVEERASKGATEMLDALARYRFSESFAVDRFLVPDLVAWVFCELSATLPKLEATPLLRGTTLAREFLDRCRGLLQTWPPLRSQGALWGSLERWLCGGERLHQTEDAWFELVALLAQAGEIDRAESLLDRLPDPYCRARAIAALARALFALGREEEALTWTRRDSEYPHIQAEALDAEVGRRIGARDLEGARRIASSIKQADHRAARLADLTVAWLDRGQPRAARECLAEAVVAAEQCESPAPLLEMLQAIAAHRPGGAELMADPNQLLERIWELTGRVNLRQSQLRIQSALVRAWAALGNPEKARRQAGLLDDLERVECLAAIAREVESHPSDNFDSRETLDRALREARQITWGWERCRALLAVAHGLAAVDAKNATPIFYESFAAAREAMAKIESRSIAHLLGDIFACLATTPEFPGCQQVSVEALEVTAELTDDWWKSRALVNAAAFFPVLNKPVEARDWVDRYYRAVATIGDSSSQADAFEAMARTLVRNRWLSEVGPCLDRIEAEKRATAQLRLAEQLVEEHREEALPLLDSAGSLAREAVRRHPTSLAKDVAETLVRCGLAEQALALAESIPDPRQRSLALSGVAFEALRQGDSSSACGALLRAMTRSASPEPEITLAFEPTALAILARELAAHDSSGRLRQQLFGAALERTKKLADPERWDDGFLSWVRLVTAGMPFEGRGSLLDTAASEIHQLSTEWRREHLLGELAETLVGAGERKRALRLAETLSSKFRYATLLAAVAREEAQEGRDRPAHDLLSRALEAIAASEPPARGRPLQSGLLPAICALSDEKLRADLIERAITSLHRIEPDTRRAETLVDFGKTLADATDGVWIAKYLSELILAIERAEMPVWALDLEERRIAILARSGDVDEALASARRIDPRSWQHPNALVRIVQELVARQLIGPAFKVFDRIHPESSCVEALRVIVAGLKSAASAGAIDAPTLFLEKLTGIGDVEARSELLAAWVEGLAQTGLSAELEVAISHRLAELERQMYQAETQDARATTLANVVKSRALLGHLDRALEVLEEANAGEMAAPALAVLVEIAAQHVEVSEKQRIFGAIRNLVQTFEDESILIIELAKLAHAMARRGFTDQAAARLTEAVDICEKLRPVRGRTLGELARPLAAGLAADNPHLVARLLSLTAEIDSEVEQVEALVALARAVPRPEDLREIDTQRISGRAWLRFLTAWRQALLSCDQVPLSVLRATLTWFPEEPGAGFGGVSCLAAALLQRGETAAYDALARSCPAVGLPLLE